MLLFVSFFPALVFFHTLSFAGNNETSSYYSISWWNEKNKTIRPGKDIRLSVVCPGIAHKPTVTWKSSKPSIVKVNRNNGRAVGLKAGKARITATAVWENGKKSSIRKWVYVKPRILIASDEKDSSTLLRFFAGRNIRYVCGVTDRIDEFDALIVPGGISPDIKAESVRKKNKAQIKEIKMFAKAKKPILCICRGMELLQTIYGGTLKKDVFSTHYEDRYRYVVVNDDWLSRKDSLFYRTKESFLTLHSHALCFTSAPKQFYVMAEDERDHTIEAIKHRKLPIYGLQWHPERGLNSDSNNSKLIDNFLHITCTQAVKRREQK